LFYEDVYSLSTAERNRIRATRRKGRAQCDLRIKNSKAIVRSGSGTKILANSLGFVGEYSRFTARLAVPIARKNGDHPPCSGHWYSTARTLKKLESPSGGQGRAQRALRPHRCA